MPYLCADPPLTARDLAGLRARLGGSGVSRQLPGRTMLFNSGRAALWGALRALGVGPGDRVLLPAYLCESVVSPVLAVGAAADFYPIDRNLRPDLTALKASIGPATRAILLIHYFGFAGPVRALQRLSERRGVALIEDCAHALFSRHGERLLGSFGAAAIFSPWKSLPLPDGGILAINRPDLEMPEPAGAAPWTTTLARLAYRGLGTVEMAAGWSPRLSLLQRPGLRRDLHDRTSGAAVRVQHGSAIARRLLGSAQPACVVARRRDHWSRLVEASSDLAWGRPLFESLPAGVCPLGFPLVVEERDRWRDRLLSIGVNVRTYWEHLPSIVATDRFPDAAWLRDRILVLPVHQGLRPSQVAWLGQTLPTLSLRKGHAALAHR